MRWSTPGLWLLCSGVLQLSCLAQPTLTLDSPQAVAMSSRTYRHPVGKVQTSAVNALKTLGYEVTKVDPLRVKTAPKVVAVGAVGNGYRATAIEASVAWDVRLQSSGPVVIVEANPRAFTGSQEVPKDSPWDEATLTRLYETFFSELEDELGETPGRATP